MKKRRLLSILLTVTMMLSMLPAWTLMASAASGTVTFSGADSTNLGQALQDGTNSNDISGIELKFFNASSSVDAAARINTGSFAYFTSSTIVSPNGCFSAIDKTSGAANTENLEHPQILVMHSADGSEFSFKSVYINGDGINQTQTKIEGFLNGVSTGFATCTLDPDNSVYDKTFDLSSEDSLNNVDEIRITNLSTWTDATYATLPHGNWAYFNDFTIGDPIASASSDAGLTSVLGQTIASGSEVGTSAAPKTANVSVENSAASPSINLVASPNFVFDAATAGYTAQPTYSVRVQSSGTADTGPLSIALGGTNPTAFTLSKTSISNIAAGLENSFDVKYNTGLSAGTYTATVAVSGSNVTPKSFNVSFTVNPAGTTYTAQIRTYVNNTLTDASETVDLRKDATVTPVPKISAGVYEVAVPSGDYHIYVGGINTGKGLIINNANNSAEVKYYTVSFSSTSSGTASGSDVNASASGGPITGGNMISSGDAVLEGKRVTITASGTGAGSYTYAWSGNGTSGQTTAALVIPSLTSAVNALCAITGSGALPANPDYKINGSGYNWSGSDETVALSGGNDTLEILRAPSHTVKIAVFSADGSTVTIDGNLVSCSNTYVSVYNDITLNLDKLSITAPNNQPAVMLNKNDLDSGKAEISVSGVCTLEGGVRQSGIYSTTDQDLTITGTGTLNTTGGDSPDSSGAGKGICMEGYSTAAQIGPGAKLTITGGVTVNATGGSASSSSGGDGVAVNWGNIEISGATLHAVSGISNANSASIGIEASYPASDKSKGGNITIIDSTVTATGDSNVPIFGGRGIYSDNNLTIQNSSVTVQGGGSITNSGGIGLFSNAGNIVISGGTVTATGGSGSINGAHAVYADKGIITVSNGATLTAVGGNGGTGLGGVGVRAVGNDGSVLNGNTVTIANSAGDVYIRGGQGVSAQRASVMGKDVYIGTGNVGSVVMESGASVRSIKNTAGGDDVYLVNISTIPAAPVEIQCAVTGLMGGTYTYRAVADADGTAGLWLPAGAQVLSAAGYTSSDLAVAANDANIATLTKSAVVTAHNSAELQTYMAASYVSTINLVSGTTYSYTGGAVTRALSINGNGATINVGTGATDTIVKKEGNTVTGPVFLAVENGSFVMRDVTLHSGSDRILAVINVKTGGTLLLDGVTFEGFFANKADDPDPTGPNMDGSHNNFGVHAEPGAISTTVQNCTFGSSNSFRNAVAIRNGTAVITNNTFVGTATPARLNQTDGFEYAVYLYGGNCTVTGNNISGYDSALTSLGYHSAAITTCPYYDLTATVTGNTMHGNARGIDGVGSWHTYSEPARARINGTALDSSANAFTIGQALKAANIFSGNADGNISLSMDQNDNYVDPTSHVEYGPPAYYDTLLNLTSTNSTSATLSFDTGEWARAMVRNAKAGSIRIEASADNGATWTTATTSASLTASSTGAAVNLAAGKTYLLRATLQITANTRPLGSTDEMPADITCYSNTVSVTISSGGSGSGSKSDTTSGGQGGASVIVNGKMETAGTVQTSTAPDGRTTTTVTVDSERLESILATKERGATVTIPVLGGPDTASGVLTGEMVKGMESRDATLVIKTDSARYTLPAAEINITAISQQLGTNVALKDITVSVSIAAPSSQMSKAVEDAAKNGGFIPMIQAADYTVTCSYGGRTVSVSSFNAYVERTVAIPDGVDPSKITTGIVVNPDGTIHHVPTKVTVIDGKYYAVINSLTNSTYSVVWNPVEFSDMKNHWAKASVNDMGSRMVVNGIGNGNYEPNRNMTRVEFAAVMVRALGLEPEKGASVFGDVAATEWYCGYVKTATAYGIIKGYSDASFGPYDTITREQAMTMIARAMKITGLQAELKDSEISSLLTNYKDGSAASNYAKNSIAACLKTEIVAGRTDNTIAPKNHITRAEAAAIVQRLLQRSDLI